MFLLPRETIWRRKAEGVKITSKPPPLCSLPPKDEALELNIKRARYKKLVWESCLDGKSQNLDPCQVIYLKGSKFCRYIFSRISLFCQFREIKYQQNIFKLFNRESKYMLKCF